MELIKNKLILVGSIYFFKGYPDFNPHDTDWVEIVDYPDRIEHFQQIQLAGKDIFRWKKLPVEDMINFELKCNCPMQIGKYLVPEVAKKLGFKLEDLKKFQPLIDTLDNKHKYEKIIYDSYLKNNDFILTEEQKKQAYLEYRKYR